MCVHVCVDSVRVCVGVGVGVCVGACAWVCVYDLTVWCAALLQLP